MYLVNVKRYIALFFRSVARRPSSVRFSEEPPKYVGDDDSDCEEDNTLVVGAGRIATPLKDPRKRGQEPPTIQEQTNTRLTDPTLDNKQMLKVKTNKKYFRETQTPESQRPPPEG